MQSKLQVDVAKSFVHTDNTPPHPPNAMSRAEEKMRSTRRNSFWNSPPCHTKDWAPNLAGRGKSAREPICAHTDGAAPSTFPLLHCSFFVRRRTSRADLPRAAKFGAHSLARHGGEFQNKVHHVDLIVSSARDIASFARWRGDPGNSNCLL